MGNSMTLKRLRTAVWLYLILLIFEGALRKWVVPSLSNPLLIVRDPIAIYILLVSRMKGILRFNPYNFWMILIGCFGIITALLQGHGNLMVAVYGARIFIIHFPLMFAIAEIFTIQDVIRYGRVLLWISLPMTALIIAQFFSPQAAFVNRGVGGDMSGAGFSGALGYYRPPGTFSFTTGTSLFYGLVAAYVFYFWFNSFLINRFLLITATVCLLLAVPFSISRTLLFEVFLSTAFMIVSVWYRPNYLKRIAIGIIIFLAAFYLIENQGFFSTGTEVFTARFTSANESEGGLNSVFMDRFLGGMIYAVENAPNMPFFGYGLGMGTNAGAQMLTGQVSFLIAEQEWGRIIGEMGLLMGFIIIIVRIVFGVSTLSKGIRELKLKNALPWMLLSFGFIQILQGQWGQPTNLGFSIISGGLVLAAFNKPEDEEEEEEDEDEEEDTLAEEVVKPDEV